MAGNIFTTLGDVEAVGNDLEWSAGSCGKGGQSPLPVGMGSPHVRIKNVQIGGNSNKQPSAMSI